MRLAGCLLLFAAVALARSTPKPSVQAEIAALPAELQVAATNCLEEFGEEGCGWNTAGCASKNSGTFNSTTEPRALLKVTSCALCQVIEEDSTTWKCTICQPGNFLNTTTGLCTSCPQGAWCGGNDDINWCDAPTIVGQNTAAGVIVGGRNIVEGVTTTAAGQWDPSQCNSEWAYAFEGGPGQAGMEPARGMGKETTASQGWAGRTVQPGSLFTPSQDMRYRPWRKPGTAGTSPGVHQMAWSVVSVGLFRVRSMVLTCPVCHCCCRQKNTTHPQHAVKDTQRPHPEPASPAHGAPMAPSRM